VQKLFNVQVLEVRTQIVRGKLKRIGRFQGRRPHWKKAIVTLQPGQTIEFFEGV
jgi:large subunit ribosomal protein L23